MKQYDFAKEDVVPEDESRVMVIMVGLPRSGKSTIVNSLYKDCRIIPVSQDDVRRSIGIRYTSESTWLVQNMVEAFARLLMIRGLSVVVDNVNLTRDRREKWYSLAKEYGYAVEVRVVHVMDEVEHSRRLTKSDFPEHTIEIMKRTLEPITKEEFQEHNLTVLEYDHWGNMLSLKFEPEGVDKLRFRSGISGMLYGNPKAAGSVSQILMGDKVYNLVTSKEEA
jgi:predicted kinase